MKQEDLRDIGQSIEDDKSDIKSQYLNKHTLTRTHTHACVRVRQALIDMNQVYMYAVFTVPSNLSNIYILALVIISINGREVTLPMLLSKRLFNASFSQLEEMRREFEGAGVLSTNQQASQPKQIQVLGKFLIYGWIQGRGLGWVTEVMTWSGRGRGY